MSRSIKVLLYLLFLSFVLGSCREQALDEFYARPESLADPIYQQLDSAGNFKHLLKCIDMAGYKRTLSSAGYFTMFAPNDEAFEKFFRDNGYGGIGDIDSTIAKKIVSYALVYNAFTRDRLVDYQGPKGWVPLGAYKRRTAYYVGVYNDIENNPLSLNFGKNILATASNRNGSLFYKDAISKAIDNNNKHIPYFIDRYFNANNLTAFDYNYFYPNIYYTGFNVAGASVVKADIFAENGYIHVINRVILPLPSIEEYVRVKPEYSKFWSLLQKNNTYFTTDPDVTRRYQVLTGSTDPVHVKYYLSSLAFSPNNENFKKESGADNDAQTGGWTMFVPDNDAFDEYVNKVLLENYPSIENLPSEVVIDFLNAHMWQATVWPTKFGVTTNFVGEEARFDPTTNIIEAKVMSNGVFYGTNKPQEANVFHTVFGRPYLDPKYSMMTKFLQRELKTMITKPDVKYTLFMISDDEFKKAGYSYNPITRNWFYLDPATGITSDGLTNLNRLIELHILSTPENELGDLTGSGIVEAYGGEYMKYSGNKVYAAGNEEKPEILNVTKSVNMTNGKVYYINGMLQFPKKSIGMKIRDMGNQTSKPYSLFYKYLINSSLVTPSITGTDTTDISISGVSPGTTHTFFIPSNAAISAAITAGLLPSDPKTAVFSERELVATFIQYHILPKFTIVPDGKKDGNLASLYRTISDEQNYLNITNTPNNLKITDQANRTATVLMNTASNVLSSRAVIHQIDTYLDYRK